MTFYRLVLIIVFLVNFGIFTISVTATPQMVKFPLKSSPLEGPYQDEEFLKQANISIYNLSNQTIPNGTALYNLLTIQQKLSKMNISPELYPMASRINDFLYYTGKAGSDYNEGMVFMDKPYSPVYDDDDLLSEAGGDYAAAKEEWNIIKDLYPGFVFYTFPKPDRKKPYSMNEDDSKVFPRGTPVPFPDP